MRARNAASRARLRRALLACWKLRLRRAVAPAAAIAVLVACLQILVGRVDRHSDAGLPEAASSELWRVWRDRLHAADRDRRCGDHWTAIEGYERVASAPSARVQDRDRARYWRARLRLAIGERSAVFDLRSTLRPGLEPMLVAGSGIAAARAYAQENDVATARRLASIVRDAHVILRTSSRVMSERGHRARAWLARYERSEARHFLR